MMKKLLAVLVVVAIAVGAVVPVLAETSIASACEGQGLTPGYWKNHPGSWAATGYSASQSFETIFGVNVPDSDPTLLDALRAGGGKFTALNRHAVAALLNAAHPDIAYPYTVAEVIAMVQGAYQGGDWESVKDDLEEANQLGVD